MKTSFKDGIFPTIDAALRYTLIKQFIFLTVIVTTTACSNQSVTQDIATEKTRRTDASMNLWTLYKEGYIEDGRVIMRDQGGITTSEGQGYAMLRAVWSDDPATFRSVWNWTKTHLQVRSDKLFAWKWHGRIIDNNTATDADTDIALALLLAGRRFQNVGYLADAKNVISNIRNIDLAAVGSYALPTAGNWTKSDNYIKIHVAYLAPYAYQEFSKVDSSFDWKRVANSSYKLLHWLYDTQGVKTPPEYVFLDRKTSSLLLRNPLTKDQADFGYDAFPLFWRLALDEEWNYRNESALITKILDIFDHSMTDSGKILDRYTIDGRPKSNYEALPLYATIASLASLHNRRLYQSLDKLKLNLLWDDALSGKQIPYYLHNWLWFDRALYLGAVRSYAEWIPVLKTFDRDIFWANFAWEWLVGILLLGSLTWMHRFVKISFLVLSACMCIDYLYWRCTQTLNFVETFGPVVSLSLLAAEVYGFSTLLLLWLQVGTKTTSNQTPLLPESEFMPSVDIFVPIYSESLDILEATLVGVNAIDYIHKNVYVCDDSHRNEVRTLGEELGAHYLPGPSKHAKAGNLNSALKRTNGELAVVFDTDHIPVKSFLNETVPWFADAKLGFIQTPHVFYNEDIFQKSLRQRNWLPNEQDMFNHGIQSGRDSWGGAFFVGSGAIFRRAALESVGGFNLLSITEDIHTSQLIHAAGWTSKFIDKNLAVGLSAENLNGYIVQRRRWMLGCLQIFFRDNPILKSGLNLRQRLGYFASLFYFFFPLSRVVFWMTPLYFLLFHGHPLLADVSALLAHLLPFVILRPLMNFVLLPKWPRLFSGMVYEAIVTFPLARSVFDLFLPKNLGFKVTPKGITSDRRVFDRHSSKLTLVALTISFVAVAKGLIEASVFGIELEAYAFNIGWAITNAIFLIVAVLIAWEYPQKRQHERVACQIPVTIYLDDDVTHTTQTIDMSLGGIKIMIPKSSKSTSVFQIELPQSIRLDATLVYRKSSDDKWDIAAFSFTNLESSVKRKMIELIFTLPTVWTNRHRKPLKISLLVKDTFQRLNKLLAKKSAVKQSAPKVELI